MINTKAAVLFSKNNIKVINLKLPKLAKTKVLVKIKYSSICHTQLQEIEGKRGKDKYLPHCLGHEATGTVIKIGQEVKKVKANDNVCLTWVNSLGSISLNTEYRSLKDNKIINAGPVNTFSEYAIVSESKVIKLKKKFNLKNAVLLGCAIPTAFNCFLNTLKNTNKENLLIVGAGGLGLSCLHAAKKLKYKNIYVLDQNKIKLNIAKKLGANKTIHTSNINFKKKINRYNNFFHNIVECTGNLNILIETIKCTKILGGKFIIIGNYPKGLKIRLNPWDIIVGRIISGAWTDSEPYEKKIGKILSLFKGFKVNYFFGKKIYKLNQINDAINDFKSGKVIRPLIRFF
tara:strand:- start:10060 stop:11094 length:1035 start_codon:yes stop_codon:yes gene_type:complete